MRCQRWITTLLAIAALAAIGANDVRAQTVLVQQPVVQQFGVRTVVSVPDRGRALLGSVSSSESFNRRTGPFVVGSNVSRRQQHSRLSVHVTIHDFEAMDAARLAEAGRAKSIDPQRSHLSNLNPIAANAARRLLQQHDRLLRTTPVDQATADSTASSVKRFGNRSLR